MFSGIIEAVGYLRKKEPKGVDLRVTVAAEGLDLSTVAVGDSIAVSGVCLTVTELGETVFKADLSAETLNHTVLGEKAVGDPLNLEKALTLATPLGGHLVTGHVDGIGRVVERRVLGRSLQFRIQAPPGLARYIAKKGSICVDGVSLTVNRVEGREFEVNLVPHTLEKTALRECQSGCRVNLEVDIIARYLERLLLERGGMEGERALSLADLIRAGMANGNTEMR